MLPKLPEALKENVSELCVFCILFCWAVQPDEVCPSLEAVTSDFWLHFYGNDFSEKFLLHSWQKLALVAFFSFFQLGSRSER